MKRHKRISQGTTLAVLSTLAIGCGNDDARDGSDLGPDGQPRIEHVELTRLQITSADEPMLLHTVKVEAELDVAGEAFETQVMFGLQAGDGELACTLGEALVASEGGATHLIIDQELIVREECADMIGSDDLELFVAFDPWRRTSFQRKITEDQGGDEDYELLRPSVLECSSCQPDTALHESPGLDAQLREVSLGSSVTTLLLPAHPDQAQMPAEDRPNLVISTTSRVTGLPYDEAPPAETFVTHRIRPLAGSQGAQGLEQSQLEWMSLLDRTEDGNGEERYAEQTSVDVRGHRVANHVSKAYIGDALSERMNDGDWRSVQEFELETCVSTDYEQATFSGELGPRDNDCAILSVVVLRESTGPAGQRSVDSEDLDDMLALGAASRGARIAKFGPHSTKMGELSFLGYEIFEGWRFGAQGEAYYAFTSSETNATTHGGFDVPAAAIWAEAGASLEAEMFGNPNANPDWWTIFSADIAAMGYVEGGGAFEYRVVALGADRIAERWDTNDIEFTRTLGDMLSEDAETVWHPETKISTPWGYTFNKWNVEFEIGVTLDPFLGVDKENTSVTVHANLGAGELSLEGKITPTIGIDANVGVAGGGDEDNRTVEIGGVLNLATVDLPVSAKATYEWKEGKLRFNESAELVFKSLAGTVGVKLDLTIPVPLLPDIHIDIDEDLFAWDGWELPFSLGEGEQVIDVDIVEGVDGGDQTGGEITTQIFCERWDGDSIHLRAYDTEGVYMYASSELAGNPHPGVENEKGVFHGWEQSPTTFTVVCNDAMTKVSFKTGDGHWMTVNPNVPVFDEFGVYTSSNALDDYGRFEVVPQNEDGAVAFHTKRGKYLSSGFTFAKVDGEIGDPVRPVQEQGHVGDLAKWEVVPK